MEPYLVQNHRDSSLNTNSDVGQRQDITLNEILARTTRRLQRTTCSILPENLSAKRAEVMVMPDLEVKTHSRVDMQGTIQAHKGRDQKDVFDRLIAPFALSPEIPEDSTSLLYVDKMRPHAKFDMMVTQANEQIAPRLEDLSPRARVRIVENVADFMSYCNIVGLTPVCSYSIDPMTFDRKSAQSSKRFHVHFVARESAEVKKVSELAVPLHTLDNFAQRRLVDETAIILGMALADKLQGLSLGGIVSIERPFAGDSNYPFLRLTAKKPMTLADAKALSEGLSALHSEYESLYSDLKEDFFLGTNSIWKRARRRPVEMINSLKSAAYLSEDTMLAVTHTLQSFSNRFLDMIEASKPSDSLRSLVSHVYPNSCPAYSVTLTNQMPGTMDIAFRPFLFSDTGGAGLSSLNGKIIKTRKDDDVSMSDGEMKEREEFQKQVLSHMGVSLLP